MRFETGDILVLVYNFAAGRREGTGNQVKQRRFTGADKSQYLSLIYRQIHIRDRFQADECLCQFLCFQ